MTTQRRAWRGFSALVSGAVLLVTSCGGESLGGGAQGESTRGGAGKGPVKVGLVVAQSGVYSVVGRDMARGFQLYLDLHDGKLGGHRIEATTVDEGDDPQQGVGAVTQVVQQKNVDVVAGIVASPTVLGSAGLICSTQTPTLIGNSGAVAVTGEEGCDHIWRTSYKNPEPAEVLGRYLAEHLPEGDKVYLMASDYAAGHETLSGFKEAFPADRIAGETYTPFGTTTDYQPYLSKIRKSGADAVFTFYAGKEAIDFTTQFAQFGLKDSVDLYSTSFLTEGSALTAEGTAALGVHTVSRYSASLDNPANEEFVAQYQERHSEVPTVYAATMYDTALVLDKALAGIPGSVDAQAVVDGLRSLGELEGVRGTWHFDDQDPVQHFYLREVAQENGELVNAVLEDLGTPRD